MNNKLLNSWDHVRGSFWFVPSVMVVGAAVLALVLLALDARLASTVIESIPLVYAGGTQATRGLLSAIASSSITVAGTTFSITIAVLTLASSNYGPRLLRSFMHDTGNQVVLGTFVATFIYCLIVLRSVSDVEDIRFVPHLATTGAILIAFLDIAVLIYFIHHMTTSIMVSTIVHNVGTELQAAIERLFPERIGHDRRERDEPDAIDPMTDPDRDGVPVPAQHSGYVQTIDHDGLLRLTTEHDLIARLVRPPGQFAIKGNALLYVTPSDRIDDELCDTINKLFAFGKQRTLTQDVEFGMLQLVEVAVRALSPSLNDPYTAVNCLDQISVALCSLADRQFPSSRRYDEQQRLRVIAEPVRFEHLIDVGLDQIRMNGNQFVMVLNKLLRVIAAVAERVHDEHILSHLRQHAVLVERASHDGISDEHDRAKVNAEMQRTLRAMTAREQALVVQHQVPHVATRHTVIVG